MEQIVETLRYLRAYFPDSDSGRLLWALCLFSAFMLALGLSIVVMWLAVKLVWLLLWAGVWILMMAAFLGSRHHSSAA